MKELSIEEKAKRYDKAIKVAKSKIKNDKDHVLYEDEVIEIFPELKESEDESIRKGLLQFLNAHIGCSIAPAFCTQYIIKWIEWLEKQGVQESPEWDEADVNRFNNLIFLVECSKEGEATKQGFIKFIKRLRGMKCENRWKPTVEQNDLKFKV